MSEPATAARVELTRRLHPTSLLFRVAAVVRTFLLPAIFVLFLASEDSKWEAWLAIGFVPVLLVSILNYITLRYDFGASELVVRRGLIFRSERQIPYERIENVDLTRNPVHRMLGVAIVRIDTASGDEAEAVFRVLSMDAVEELREQIAERAGSESTIGAARQRALRGDAEDPPGLESASASEAREPGAASVERIHALGVGELLRLGLISNRGLLGLAALYGIATRFEATEDWLRESFAGSLVAMLSGEKGFVFALYGVAILVAALLVLSVAWTVVRYARYRLERSGDLFRWSAGSWTHVTATIPLQRIQKLVVRQSPLQRLIGRVSLRVDTVGGGEEDEKAAGRADFVPLCRIEDVARIVERAMPEVVMPRPGDYEALHPKAAIRQVRSSLVSAPLVFGLAWAFMDWKWAGTVALLVTALSIWHGVSTARWGAYYLSETAIFVRQGFWTRRWTILPTDRVQVISLRHSPFDRRWGMATLSIDSAGASSLESVDVEYCDGERARALYGELAEARA